MMKTCYFTVVAGALATFVQGAAQEPKALLAAKETPVAEQKRQSADNLYRIALALHDYHDKHKQMPGSAWLEPNLQARFGNSHLTAEQLARAQGRFKGRPLPLLSWRVAILPYLDGDGERLYEQFKLDQPWDSEHNKKLLSKMPAVYAAGSASTRKAGTTYYQVFTGSGAPFDGMVGPRTSSSFPAGTQAFLVVEAAQAVPWTKPQDLPYAPGKPLPKLGGLFADGFHAVMASAVVRFIPRATDEKTLRALIAPIGAKHQDMPGVEVW